MEEIKKMNVNGIGAGYPAAGKAKVRQAQDGTQSFDREFMGMASQTPPSFVGKVWTKEELMQSVDKQVQSNQMILSRLVDTFSSRILYPMLLLSGNHSIAVV